MPSPCQCRPCHRPRLIAMSMGTLRLLPRKPVETPESDMAMQEKHRNEIYTYFAPRLGEEATQAMMSQFPARDLDEPTTKADLALVKADLALLKVELLLEIER